VTRKAEVYLFIKEKKLPSYSDWISFQRAHPFIRVKQDSKQRALINFSGRGEWMDPISWANNYLAEVTERLNGAWADYVAISEVWPAKSDIIDVMQQSLQDELDKEQDRITMLIRSECNEVVADKLLRAIYPKS